MASPYADQTVSVLFKHGGLVPRFREDHIAIYGTEGAIYLEGHYGTGPVHLHDGQVWSARPTPADLAASVRPDLGETEQYWLLLAERFVADIRGEPAAPYPGFDTGALYQNIIDALRRSDTWHDIEGETA